MHGTRQPGEDNVKNSRGERAKRRGEPGTWSKLLAWREPFIPEWDSRGAVSSDADAIIHLPFFSPSFSFPNLLPAVIRSLFQTGGRLSDAEPEHQWCCGSSLHMIRSRPRQDVNESVSLKRSQDQVPSIYSFSLLNWIILSLTNLRLFSLFLFITAPVTCLSAARCSSSPDVDAASPRGFRRSPFCLCKTSVCGGKGLNRVS